MKCDPSVSTAEPYPNTVDDASKLGATHGLLSRNCSCSRGFTLLLAKTLQGACQLAEVLLQNFKVSLEVAKNSQRLICRVDQCNPLCILVTELLRKAQNLFGFCTDALLLCKSLHGHLTVPDCGWPSGDLSARSNPTFDAPELTTSTRSAERLSAALTARSLAASARVTTI